MSETEPIQLRARKSGHKTAAEDSVVGPSALRRSKQVFFTRQELNLILSLYGRRVAAGEWRDYAIDMGSDVAVFSVYRNTSECPIYRVEKNPKLAKKQGAFSVVAATGLIMKRGHDLRQVLSVLEKKFKLVEN